MTEEQPQLFTIPVQTLTRVVNFLGELPFNQVAPIMLMINQTVKEIKNDTVHRSKPQRRRGRPKQ